MAVEYRSAERHAWGRLLLPWHIVQSLSRHGMLIRQLAKREILARYRGSFLGPLWSLLRPLAMLGVYTLVFGFILEPRLPGGAGSRLEFVLSLFCGLVFFDFVSECLGLAPALVLRHPNYVKRVVFPLEILTVSTVGAALVQLAISLVPFFIGVAAIRGGIPPTALFLPLVVLPLVLFALAASWLLSSLGVFVRDINALVPVATMILLFASAVFYSLDSVPERFRGFFLFNPVAVLIDEARKILLLGVAPSWVCLAVALAAGTLAATLAYAFFMATKRGFADVM